MSGHQALQDLALPLGERGKLGGECRAVLRLAAFLTGALLGHADGAQDGLLLERLLDEIDGARLHRLHRERDVAMAGDHDDGKAGLFGAKLAQQLQSGHPGHAHIGDDAAAFDAGKRRHEGTGRFVEADRDAGGTEQKGERLAHRLIVVNDMDHEIIGHRCCPFPLKAPR